MSSSVSSATASNIQALTQSVLTEYDANRDAQLSADEFSNFLAAFVKNMTGGTPATGSASTTASAPFLSSLASPQPATAEASLPPCPAGWDGTKWANPAHTTVKYVAGRIMARYRPADWLDAGKREEILAQFRAAGYTPTAVGRDCCDFGDGNGPIDIVQAASVGGRAWQWLPVREG